MYTGTKIKKQVYIGHVRTITSNPTYGKARNGIHLSDYSTVLSSHNHRYYVKFDASDDINELSFLVTWNILLDGKMDVIQIQAESIEYRNVLCNFDNRSKTKHGINCMMDALFSEIYGDRIPSMHLLHCCPQLPISCNQSIRLVKLPIPMTAYTSDRSSPSLMNPIIESNILRKIYQYLSCPRN